MFGLFEKQSEQETAPAGPVTIDLALKFEPGFAILEGAGVRFRIAQADAETLVGQKTATARKFAEVSSPGRGVFDLEKTAKIARWLKHGLDLSQAARLLNERSDDVRAYYAWSLSQGAWNDAPAQAKRAELAEGDRVRSVAPIPGGTIKKDGRLCSALTGVPIPEFFKTLNGTEVSRALADAGGDTKGAAKALRVDPDDLAGWLERNAEMMAAI